MQLHEAKIIKKTKLCSNEWRFDFAAPALCEEAMPGQFVMVECSHGSTPFLRRAISINQCKNGVLSLMFAVVGDGTEALAAIEEGETVSLLGPLGRGFDLDVQNQHIVMIGGGIGKAPFEFVTDALLKKNNRLTFIVGGRSAEQLQGLEAYNDKNVTLLYATEDGSLGEKGFVNTYFDRIRTCDRILACGPTPMLAAVKRFADEAGIPCQLSLEGKMACGVGVCLGCTCKSGNPDAEVYPKVCQDGPVFWSEEVELA
ncbi:MAG: dihydroorotate dehydrogenase electron transfer subunit [Peptococcaceae bacterium]|nr:dihydroorotate dehydrogenase electron transfer subunit [Peptococcaceae bacterium]